MFTKSTLFFFVALTCTVVYLSCSSDRMPGEEFTFRSIRSIYLYADAGKHIPLTQKHIDMLFDDVEWMGSPGITLVEKTVEVNKSAVSWKRGSREYTASGARIVIKGKIKIGDDCPEGKHLIAARLPALTLLSEVTETKPMFQFRWMVSKPEPMSLIDGVYVLPVRGVMVKQKRSK